MEVMFGARRLQPPGVGCTVLQFSVLFFLFSVKAVLYSHLAFLLEESSVFVPLCDSCALPDTVTQLVSLCQSPEVCAAS